ncbi:hypothetical protein [Gordonia sp. MMO-8]|uniref:hypothetical protein n=1 Tax=Gordonia sp. MMO-8 TaxID=3127886 RepID=UPI0030171779
MKRILLSATAATAAALVIAGCSSSNDAATSSTVGAPPITSTAAPECKAAPDATVALITAALTDSGLSLANAQAVDGEDGAVYIAANIMQGDKREHSAEVWATKDGKTVALSSNARSETSLRDGRKLGLSAGDSYGSAAQQCVVADLRRQNRTGSTASAPTTADAPVTVTETVEVPQQTAIQTTPTRTLAPGIPPEWDKNHDGAIDTDAPIG